MKNYIKLQKSMYIIIFTSTYEELRIVDVTTFN